MAERGGFSWGEMDEYFPEWREATDDQWLALQRTNTSLQKQLRSLQAEVQRLTAEVAARPPSGLPVGRMALQSTRLKYRLEDESGYLFHVTAEEEPETGWSARVLITSRGYISAEGAVSKLVQNAKGVHQPGRGRRGHAEELSNSPPRNSGASRRPRSKAVGPAPQGSQRLAANGAAVARRAADGPGVEAGRGMILVAPPLAHA